MSSATTPTGPTPTTSPLLPRVRLFLEKTATLAEGSGDPDAAARLRAELAKPENPKTSVVVVGETKRGKSSLVNALLGRPGLLPVDADVATSVYLAIGYAEKDGARVSTGSGGTEVVTDVPIEAVGDYASMAGNPDNVKEVNAVEIGLDHPLLAQGLTLVDTPGVGGLEAGHTTITLAQLPYADALVFVLDPNAPITEPELKFLQDATDRIETVVFVLTKTDAFPGWAAIAEEDRGLIKAHAPRFADCPFVAVSSALKARADQLAEAGAADDARRMLTESGFDRLAEVLALHVVGRAGLLRLGNLCRMATSTLAGLQKGAEVDLRSAEGDPTLESELVGEQERFAAFSGAQARWRQDLAQGFGAIAVDVTQELNRSQTELRHRMDAQLDRVGPDIYHRLPREMADAIQGNWLDINTFLQDRARSVVDGLAGAFELEGVDIAFGDAPLPERLADLPPVRMSKEEPKDIKQMIAEYWPAALPGLSLKGLLMTAGLTMAPYVAIPLMIGGSVIVGGAMVANRQKQGEKIRTRTDATKYIGEVLQDAGIELGPELQRRQLAMRSTVEAEIGGRVAKRQEALKTSLEAHRGALRSVQADRDRAQATVKRRMSDIAALLKTSGDLRRDYIAAGAGPAPAATSGGAPGATAAWLDQS